MEEDLEYQKGFYYPQNDKRLEKFSKLNEEQQLRAIEIGCLIMEVGEDKYLRIKNGEKRDEIDKLNKMYIKELDSLKNEIKERERNLTEFKSKTQIEKRDLILEIKTEMKEKYETLYDDKITGLDSEISNLKQKNDSIMQKQLESQQKYYEDLLLSKKENGEIAEKIRAEYNQKLEVYREKIDEINKKNENSTIKGQIGEDWVYNELLRQFPMAEIRDHHTKGHTGDFSIVEEDATGMIESKNYNRNVNKKEVEKFRKDMKENDSYKYGIFLSLTRGVVNRKDFSLEFIMGKPVIFLHKVKENSKNIKTAYNICKLILKNMDCFDIQKEETQQLLKEIIKSYTTNHKKILSNLKDFDLQMTKQLESQFNQFTQIIQLINVEY